MRLPPRGQQVLSRHARESSSRFLDDTEILSTTPSRGRRPPRRPFRQFPRGADPRADRRYHHHSYRCAPAAATPARPASACFIERGEDAVEHSEIHRRGHQQRRRADGHPARARDAAPRGQGRARPPLYRQRRWSLGVLVGGWKAKANLELIEKIKEKLGRAHRRRAAQGRAATPASRATKRPTSWRPWPSAARTLGPERGGDRSRPSPPFDQLAQARRAACRAGSAARATRLRSAGSIGSVSGSARSSACSSRCSARQSAAPRGRAARRAARKVPTIGRRSSGLTLIGTSHMPTSAPVVRPRRADEARRPRARDCDRRPRTTGSTPSPPAWPRSTAATATASCRSGSRARRPVAAAARRGNNPARGSPAARAPSLRKQVVAAAQGRDKSVPKASRPDRRRGCSCGWRARAPTGPPARAARRRGRGPSCRARGRGRPRRRWRAPVSANSSRRRGRQRPSTTSACSGVGRRQAVDRVVASEVVEVDAEDRAAQLGRHHRSFAPRPRWIAAIRRARFFSTRGTRPRQVDRRRALLLPVRPGSR